MPSSERRPRLDGYARPVPELADARQAVTMQEPTNQAKLSLLHALIEDVGRGVLRRQWYGSVAIRFSVKDGIIQADIYAGLERNWKHMAEDV